MAEVNGLLYSGLKDFGDVTLSCEDEPKIPAHSVILGRSVNSEDLKNALMNHEASRREDVHNSTESAASTEVNKIKVNYCLNKVKNLDGAKLNANRPIKLARLVTNDTNLRYLHIKEDMLKFR